MASPEARVTTQDLQSKWQEITGAVKRQAERKVLGASALTVGGIVLGVGALGIAFWLGRRSVHRDAAPTSPRPEQPVASQAAPGPDHSSLLARALEPALGSALNALARAGVNALTKKLEGDTRTK